MRVTSDGGEGGGEGSRPWAAAAERAMRWWRAAVAHDVKDVWGEGGSERRDGGGAGAEGESEAEAEAQGEAEAEVEAAAHDVKDV